MYFGEAAKKEHLMKRARKKDSFEHGAVAVWRERNIENLWHAFLDVLKCHGVDAMGIYDANEFESQETNANVMYQHVPMLPPMQSFKDDTSGAPLERELKNDVIDSTQPTWNDFAIEGQQQQQGDTLQSYPTKTKKRAVSQHATESAQSTFEIVQTASQEISESLPTENEQYTPKKRTRKTHPIPSFLDICRLVPTEDKAVEFLISRGVFTSPKDTICIHCGYKGFRRKEKDNPKSLKCNRCNKSQSIARNTFFQNTKSSYRSILQLAAYWLQNTPRSHTMKHLKCSCATLTEFHRAFRKLIERTIDDELRVMALTADKKAMAKEIPNGARKDELDEHYCVVLWREVNSERLWDAFLVALSEYYPCGNVEDGAVTNEIWVDKEKGNACCKYHMRMHIKVAAAPTSTE